MNSLDPRVEQGMRRQLAQRRDRLAAGEQPLGWKAGFGAPSAQTQFSLEGPLVGFLTDRSLVAAGSEVSIAGWSRPVAEPELAAYLTSDLSPRATVDEVSEAVGMLAPAVELADVDPPPGEVEVILAGNIFHRYVILGQPQSLSLGGLDGLQIRVVKDGELIAAGGFSFQLTGPPAEVIAHLARVVGHFGEVLRAGEVVICGSVVPPLALEPGDLVSFTIEPLGEVSVRLGP
ncbi:MAG TPA: fumarylacetoacetate hydrolase family protein [Acidimicrobiia bacterium]|nr:fumarylacetoacetate hydrolase family protein [Acidimicrobiia bacterium]